MTKVIDNFIEARNNETNLLFSQMTRQGQPSFVGKRKLDFSFKKHISTARFSS